MKFEDILTQHHIPFLREGSAHCRPGWLQLDCPLCGKDTKKYHLGYNLEGKYCNCWRCGWHSLYEVLSCSTSLSYHDIKRLLDDIDSQRITTYRKQSVLKLPKRIEPLAQAHKKYLKKRGYDPNQIEKYWDVKGIRIDSRLGWRVFIPIYHNGVIVSWTTRSISDETKMRYITAKDEDQDIPLKDILYGQDYATHSVIVCEGIFDVWKIGPGAVATFGIDYTTSQIKEISKFPRRAICFDNEEQAQKQAQKLTNILSMLPGETYMITIDAKDPGVADDDEIKELRNFLKG